MTREGKDHDARKNEILDTSLKLFLTKGYASTSIQEIIDEVGIAKGTFYHYFKSKDELLNILMDRLVERVVKIYKIIIRDESLNAIEKLFKILSTIIDWKIQSGCTRVMKDLLKMKPQNVEFWYNLRRTSIVKISPLLQELVEQGVVEKSFEIQSPCNVGEIVLQIVFDLKEMIGFEYKEIQDIHQKKSIIIKKVESYRCCIETLLGLPRNILCIYDEKIIEMMIEKV